MDLIEEGKEQDYDKEKYLDMLLEAAETVLEYFRFNGIVNYHCYLRAAVCVFIPDLLNGGANHFKGFPELPVERVAFAENGKIVTRPGNDTLYSNDMYTDKMLGYLKNSTDGKPFFAYLAFQVAHSP